MILGPGLFIVRAAPESARTALPRSPLLSISPKLLFPPAVLHSALFPTYSLGVHPLPLPLFILTGPFPSPSLGRAFARSLLITSGQAPTPSVCRSSLATPSPPDQSFRLRPLNREPRAQDQGLSRRARQLTQDEAEENEPRARNRGEAEAHHDPTEQAAATRAATAGKRLAEP